VDFDKHREHPLVHSAGCQQGFWEPQMSKTHRKIKKANHGRRPANAKARRKKRWIVKT
jgi:hypothetical protein